MRRTSLSASPFERKWEEHHHNAWWKSIIIILVRSTEGRVLGCVLGSDLDCVLGCVLGCDLLKSTQISARVNHPSLCINLLCTHTMCTHTWWRKKIDVLCGISCGMNFEWHSAWHECRVAYHAACHMACTYTSWINQLLTYQWQIGIETKKIA